MDSNSIFATFFISILFSTSLCDADEQYTECHRPFNCGSIENLTYPFWGDDRPEYCGRKGFKLQCPSVVGKPVVEIDRQKFYILKANLSNYNLTIARLDLWKSSCPESPQAFLNTSSDYTLFSHLSTVENTIFFYNCTTIISPRHQTFECNTENGNQIHGVYANDFMQHLGENCEFGVRVPVLRAALEELGQGRLNLDEVLKQGFEVEYDADRELCDKCKLSGGICGSNRSSPSHFSCLCRDHPYPSECPKNGHQKTRLKIIIGVVAVFVGIFIGFIIVYIYLRRIKKKYASPFLSRNISSDPSSLMDKEKGDSFYGVHVFTYTELEEATNNFDPEKELGDGGFGTVYYGQLRDGRAVAVKRLYENNYKRVEQFMNEVEILTRLRHQHLVSLYGCTSRHSRELLLVYEYISNGTVADHLHGDIEKRGALPWPTRMNIAIETACALSYLHASEIIHRDVKTNNILLDKNFCVKVADFGLSRLFPIDVTHVSTAPAGTPGYVDPEYHQCYQLTSKSDVYSFGVVLIELISSMPAVDITRHRHEINLSNMAINKIQNHELHELVDPGLGFESDDAVRRIITEVADLAFKCLQSEKEMRPSMAEVLEALKDIQNDGNNEHKAAAPEKDNTRDDAVLLKNDSLPSSDGII